MLRVGVTGGIGSGKSAVCRILEALGVPVFHADEEAKRLYDEDATVKENMVAAFGRGLYPNDAFDRSALAAIIFHDGAARSKVNAIVHPALHTRFGRWCAQQRTANYVVMEAAILAETGGHAAFDHLVVVTAPEDLRVRRVMARDGVGEKGVWDRMDAQGGDAERLALADTVIVNDERSLVIPQVLALHEKLNAR